MGISSRKHVAKLFSLPPPPLRRAQALARQQTASAATVTTNRSVNLVIIAHQTSAQVSKRFAVEIVEAVFSLLRASRRGARPRPPASAQRDPGPRARLGPEPAFARKRAGPHPFLQSVRGILGWRAPCEENALARAPTILNFATVPRRKRDAPSRRAVAHAKHAERIPGLQYLFSTPTTTCYGLVLFVCWFRVSLCLLMIFCLSCSTTRYGLYIKRGGPKAARPGGSEL